MSKAIRLFLDQMIQKHVADVLAQEGYDVVRASEVGQSRADDRAILENAILEQRISTINQLSVNKSMLPKSWGLRSIST